MLHVKRLVSVLAGIALALAPASVSPAVPLVGTDIPLRWLTCAAGTTTIGTLTPLPYPDQAWRAPGGDTLLIVGADVQLRPCRTPESTHGYAVAIYSPTRGLGRIARYTNLDPSGSDRDVVEVEPTDHAMCLLASNNVRLDCFEILWETNVDGGVRPQTGARIAVDSSLVNMSATVNMIYTDDVGPICMTCDD